MTDESKTRWMIVGLGNPGARYARTRHNIGFLCIETLARACAAPPEKARFKALLTDCTLAGKRLVLLRPQTFMNDSGLAVGPASHWFKIPPERILVIHDDLDLPLGRVRFRPGGSSAGHRGLNSIISSLGRDDFMRMRVGIGRPTVGDPIDYVLGRFTPDQEPIVQVILDAVPNIVHYVVEQGIRAAMNQFNGTSLPGIPDQGI